MTKKPGWHPNASLEVLHLRAAMLASARAFFAAKNLLEVTTPTIADCTVTDANIESIRCQLATRPNRTFFLQTSPEYSMKRLLAAYQRDIYQICPVYRDDELGRYHNAEFTMIEWYRQHVSYDNIIAETLELLATLAFAGHATLPAASEHTYSELFEQKTGMDPLSVGVTQLSEYARDTVDVSENLAAELGDDVGAWLGFLFGAVVTPGLEPGKLVIIRDYPCQQAALARLDSSDKRIAQRFEIFWDRLEIANGYYELADPAEQRARFAADRKARSRRGLREIAADEKLLAALDYGLPDCCGVAVGFDRVVMRCAGLASLTDAVSFSLT